MIKISQEMVLPEQMVVTLNNVKSILDNANIDSVLIGGIAVGAHSSPRSTSDIDFAIKNSDLPKLQSLFDLLPLALDVREGMTTSIDGVDVDFVILEPNEYFLLKNQVNYSKTNSINVSSYMNMIWLKLTSGKRSKDSTDVIQILKKLNDEQVASCRAYFSNIIKSLDLSSYDKQKLKEDIFEDFDSLSNIAKLENQIDKTASTKYIKYLANKLA
jgi:hypothetical protein